MATSLVPGQQSWKVAVDADGQRTYQLISLVVSDDPKDGPYTALQTSGLPATGAAWQFGNDSDPDAYCLYTADAIPVITDQPNKHWKVTNTFSSKTPKDQRCSDSPPKNPLLEPQKISGGYTKYQEEATEDRYGNILVNSAFEQIRGPQVEFDANRSNVKISQNVAQLQLPFVAAMLDTVNGFPLWELPPRCVKLSSFSWERKFYGSCNVYFTRSFEFDIRTETFDRWILDEGSKVLKGKWENGQWVLQPVIGAGTTPNPDPGNPGHFIGAVDPLNKRTTFILNGHGVPITGLAVNQHSIPVYYISIQAGNTNHPVTNQTYWLQDLGGGASEFEGRVLGSQPPAYVNSSRVYQLGDMATMYDISTLRYVTFICVATNGSNHVPVGDTAWVQLANGTTDRGTWGGATTYAIGDRVADPQTVPSDAGYKFVQHYEESNFLLLGIPAVLGANT